MDEMFMIVGGGVALLAATAFGTMWWRERGRRVEAERARFSDAVHASGKFVLLQMRLERRERQIRALAAALRRAETRVGLKDAWIAELRGSVALALQAFGRQADEAASLAKAWSQEADRRRLVEGARDAALAELEAVAS